MLDRIAEFFVFGIVPLAVGMLATPLPSQAAEQILKGEVIYRERIALPPHAMVTVQLADVSRADAPATVVAAQTIKPSGQVPVPFVLKFDTSAIKSKSTYALQARISVDGVLMFLNDVRHQVEPLSGKPQTILVKMVRKNAGEAGSLVGRIWSLQFVDGIGAVESKATLHVDESGKVTAQAPCNRYFANAKVKGRALTIGNPGATMMACEAKLMTQEQAFFKALGKVAAFKVKDGRLILLSAKGRELLRFAAAA